MLYTTNRFSPLYIARFIAKELALEIVKKFLNTKFEGGRHKKRVEKIEI
jgi:ribose 5-phosphate isomerase RpiB